MDQIVLGVVQIERAPQEPVGTVRLVEVQRVEKIESWNGVLTEVGTGMDVTPGIWPEDASWAKALNSSRLCAL